jgi:tRNA(Ile)-lysidine synthetase-like protein
VLKRACAEASGAGPGINPPRLSNDHLDRLVCLVSRQEGDGRVSLPGVTAWRSFSQVLIYKRVADLERLEPALLPVPGSARLHSGAPLVRAKEAEIRAGAYNEGSSWLDGSLAPGPFVLRPWRSGDRCGPAGERGARSLHELLQCKKIPAWDRFEWPVLEWRGQVVWTRGFGVAPGWRAGSGNVCPIEIAEEPVAARG